MKFNILNTLRQNEIQLLSSLFSRKSLHLLDHCVKGITELADFQTVSIAFAVITKACLLNIDTGLGKTLISAGVINILRALKPKLKWVYICPCSNLSTTATKLDSYLFNANLTFCDSTESKILNTFFTRKAANSDVLVLSYEAIVKSEVESFLFRNRDIYQGIILDESQMLSNLTSHTSRLISAILNTACYKILLSATPLRVSIEQVVNQIYMIDRMMFSQCNMESFLNEFRVWSNNEIVGYKNLDELKFLLMPRMLSFSRSDLDIRGDYFPQVELCRSGLDRNASIQDVIAFKANSFSSTMKKLIALLTNYKRMGKRGLIYANRNVLKTAIYKSLADTNIRTDILDGSHTVTQQSKEKVHKTFLAGELDVLITNISMGKDLPCDYIIFYELSFDYKQMIGRGERGLSGTDLDVIFVLTDSEYEVRFFYRNVFQRCVLLEKLCGKDMPELHDALAQIKQVLAERGLNYDDAFSN